MVHSSRSCLPVLAFLLATAVAAPAGGGDVESLRINDWLVLGPMQSTVPVFEEGADHAPLTELLEAASLPGIRDLPEAGQTLDAFDVPVSWRVVRAGNTEPVRLEQPDWAGDRRVAVSWFATSIRNTRFVSATVAVESKHPWKLVLDGDPVDAEDLELDLEPGDHVLALATVFDPEADEGWTVSVTLNVDVAHSVSAHLQRDRELSILDVLDATSVTAFDLSPSGDRVALTVSRVEPGTDGSETWVELRSTVDGSLLRTWRGAPAMTQVRFAPTGDRLSYVTKDDEKKTSALWLADLEAGSTVNVVGGIEDWDSYLWSPSGEAVVFSTTTKAEEDTRGITRLEGLLDRMAGHRNLAELSLVDISSGLRRRLTGGRLSAAAAAFSPDGSKILVTREVEDLSRRPYSRQELWEIDLKTGTANKLRDFWWFGSVEYSPDGRRLLVQAGPSEFGEAGIAVDGQGPVNDFDGQLFVWDPETDAVEAITRQFNPAVAGASWSRFDHTIIVLAADGHRRSLFRYDPAEKTFSPIPTGIESVGSFAASLHGPVLVAEGTSVWQPQRVVVAGGDDDPERLLFEPASERFAHVLRGEVREWNIALNDGREVAGRVYYPTTFDPDRLYPAIVNYYGGTSPMNRSFGGRYPAEWWAANGYVAYVLTPTGAYGWGQEQSTVHVNDWGEVTSRQIVEATAAFLEAHPFVDPRRIGCIGASYGGFMTMKLITETDLFAAAVAHAGISALSSYWGEGYWGYSYGAVANADSFPWNRRDIFVDRSPLFNADKVVTPLLLTHGDDDPNVPPGESDQFYAALKILDVEVEYLRVAGLGHLIMEHDKRALWSKSIVAWFDRLLKDEPQWWDALYPPDV